MKKQIIVSTCCGAPCQPLWEAEDTEQVGVWICDLCGLPCEILLQLKDEKGNNAQTASKITKGK